MPGRCCASVTAWFYLPCFDFTILVNTPDLLSGFHCKIWVYTNGLGQTFIASLISLIHAFHLCISEPLREIP